MLDSGASVTLARPELSLRNPDQVHIFDPIGITSASGDTLKSNHKIKLNSVVDCHIVDHFGHRELQHNLLSINQLTDNGCTITLKSGGGTIDNPSIPDLARTIPIIKQGAQWKVINYWCAYHQPTLRQVNLDCIGHYPARTEYPIRLLTF